MFITDLRALFCTTRYDERPITLSNPISRAYLHAQRIRAGLILGYYPAAVQKVWATTTDARSESSAMRVACRVIKAHIPKNYLLADY